MNTKQVFIFFNVFVLVLGLIIFHLKDHWILSGDGLGYYAHVSSVLIDGDLDFENEFRDYNPRNHAIQKGRIPETGRVGNKYPVGPALLWSPFIILAHGLSYLFDLPSNGYSTVYQLLLLIASIFYGSWGLYFIYKFCRVYFAKNISMLACVSFALASNVIYYMIIAPAYAHVTSLFAVSGFIYYFFQQYGQNRTRKNIIALGVLGAFAILTRQQSAILVVLPFYELLSTSFYKKRIPWQKLKGYLLGLAIAIILFIPQFLVWKEIYGSYFTYSYGSESFTHWKQPFLFSTLFSARNGYFFWHPMCLIGLGAAFYFIIKKKKKLLPLILLFCIQWYLYASWHSWYLGVSFGYRGFVNLSLIPIVGLSFLFSKFHSKAFYFLLSVLILWNLNLFIQFSIGLIPGDQPLDPVSLIKNIPLVVGEILQHI